MDAVHIRVNQAENLYDAEHYEAAYRAYGEVVDLILDRLQETRRIRRVSKGAGWAMALLTGGFGVEDIVIVPLVNKALLRLLGLNLDDLLDVLLQCVTIRLTILGLSKKILARTAIEDVLSDFLLAYKLADQEGPRQTLKAVFELVDPFSDPSSVSGEEKALAGEELQRVLMKEVQKPGQRVQFVNGQFFIYLLSVGAEQSTLYQILREGREHEEASFFEEQREPEPTPEPEPAQPHHGKTHTHARQARAEDRAARQAMGKAQYYGRVLGVKGRVTRRDIKRRYRVLLKQYHPDKFQDADPKTQQMAEARTRDIIEAFAFFKKEYSI